ncbi:hypothetical protein ACFPZ0_15565 [Streptomonospora nanhaiensis]|uniref:Uncharacterized protein n=1 Tax=Streptomonospora nanhaiensis TaxID=1323731 RepID=A0A853BJY8_9ACTN|nr:hypothetical protein [Streptomonospora nanhaiensis]MBV2362406.1 hypothetical protein [Streptomonospora nanhaiensis]MBX9389123.1 hypothetical protein [Streptomonospora nanhaiensis]NYI94937.1 hypothetical protein [Streptomonospora nanhaiensis]
MAEPNRDSTGSQDIIDDALRLVDALQRRLIVAGVRRGAAAPSSAPPRKGDVWEEAVREQYPEPEPTPVEQLLGIAREKGPEVVGHLGRAGMALAGALGETFKVVESTLERRSREAAARRGDTRADSGSGADPADPGPRQISRGG